MTMNMHSATAQQCLTGKPSIDRPWLQYYPKELLEMQIPACTLYQYLKDHCKDPRSTALHYYGSDMPWSEIFSRTDRTARALRAAGFGEGDQIPVFLRSVPEFIFLLLAAERIGASVVSRDHKPEENAEAAAKAKASVVFAHDFISQEDLDALYAVSVKKLVLISPCTSASAPPAPHIRAALDAQYHDTHSPVETISWEDFLSAGESFTGSVDAEINIDRPLFRAYTTGSTGPSKQVIHSARTIISILHQMNFYGSSDRFRPTWLLTVLPPFLVSVVISMILLPLASGKLLILDPFCSPQDIDLEMMQYRPNCWPLIPMFMEVLMKSRRIPDDYDMSHLLFAGAGCEAFNNGQVKRMQEFLTAHQCKAMFTVGYGQSEAGSNATFHCPAYPVGGGNIGMPMPLNNMTVCKPGTQEELTYGERGEICICSPGNMLGYDDPEKTVRTLRRHPDGKLWLHTGDIGYVNGNGCFFICGRGFPNRYVGMDRSGDYLAEISMENRIVDAEIPGILDAFFVIVGDKKHPGCYVPYLYVILQDGFHISDIESAVRAVLKDHEQPIEIICLPERPFYHFKTDRIELSRTLGSRMAAFTEKS